MCSVYNYKYVFVLYFVVVSSAYGKTALLKKIDFGMYPDTANVELSFMRAYPLSIRARDVGSRSSPKYEIVLYNTILDSGISKLMSFGEGELFSKIVIDENAKNIVFITIFLKSHLTSEVKDDKSHGTVKITFTDPARKKGQPPTAASATALVVKEETTQAQAPPIPPQKQQAMTAKTEADKVKPLVVVEKPKPVKTERPPKAAQPELEPAKLKPPEQEKDIQPPPPAAQPAPTKKTVATKAAPPLKATISEPEKKIVVEPVKGKKPEQTEAKTDEPTEPDSADSTTPTELEQGPAEIKASSGLSLLAPLASYSTIGIGSVSLLFSGYAKYKAGDYLDKFGDSEFASVDEARYEGLVKTWDSRFLWSFIGGSTAVLGGLALLFLLPQDNTASAQPYTTQKYDLTFAPSVGPGKVVALALLISFNP